MPDSDFITMGQILTKIFRISNVKWREGDSLEGRRVNKTTLSNYDKLQGIKSPIHERELENLLRKSRPRRLLLDKPFYLPPLRRNGEFVPILTMDWKIRDEIDISIGIEMYTYIHMFPGVSQSHLRSIGFRFDIHKGSKTHDYMHVQITQQGCPDWLPTTLPCIPTLAKDAVSLLFCALTSLYGKNMYNMLFSGMDLPKKHLEPLQKILKLRNS